MRVTSIITVAISFLLLTGFVRGGQKAEELVTPSGFKTEGWLYKPEDQEKPVGIVFLHGKRGNPSSNHNSRFIQKMREKGYAVMAPVMPWSAKRYEGTRKQGLEVVDAAIKAQRKDKVIVIGHSMGAPGALQYGARGAAPQVIGLVAVALGHDPNISLRIRGETEIEADSACELVRTGKGKKRGSYPDLNKGQEYTIRATAEYYCTYFNVSEFPDTSIVVSDIKLPVLWISGARDRLTHIYDAEAVYRNLPTNDKSRYEELPGKHLDVLYRNVDVITRWIEQL